LDEEAFDLSYLIRCADKESGCCVVIVKDNGERSFIVSRAAGDSDLRLNEIDLSLLDETRAVSIGSLFCLKELDAGGAREIFKAARGKGVLTFADMTADAFQIGGNAVADVYPYTDYLIPSLEEGRYVTGLRTPEEIAGSLLEKGAGTVVLKLGEEGCYVKTRDGAFFSDPFLIEPRDTTGCGDNFTAAFITGVLKGLPLRECTTLGNAAGALNATQTGSHGAVNGMERLRTFINETAIRHIPDRGQK
jgi:sugar/nucleoside kinase (ribokinase family)